MTNLEKIKYYCNEYGAKFYPNYSGRGMYGANCIGVVTDDPHDAIAEIGIRGAYTDNLGRSTIVYYPSIKDTEDTGE